MPERYGMVAQGAIFGSMLITAGLLSIALPETADQELPETVDDANSLG